MISPHDALDAVLERVRPLPRCSRRLDDALGYCLASDVRADRDMPAADRSAMDGFAVQWPDLSKQPCILRVKGEIAAGQPTRVRVTPGACVRIFTGANVPTGADTVVKVEETDEKDGFVTVASTVARGANILRRGENARKGTVLLAKGTCLDPSRIGVCAAVGKAVVQVHRRPTIALLCTGEELREVGERVRRHEIRDSNGPALRAALVRWGFDDVVHRRVPDDITRLTGVVRRAVARRDVIVLSGGVSVGAYDFVPEAVKRVGGTIRFHGVAMKPGKPNLYATLPGNRYIFGLPGNPLSAMNGLCEFVLPALRRMSGRAAAECAPLLKAPLAAPLAGKGGKRVGFALAHLVWTDNGPRLAPVASRGSADLVSAGQAAGMVIVPAGVRTIAAGTLVDFRPWRPLS